jgi:type IV pilus assembly protein PilY1
MARSNDQTNAPWIVVFGNGYNSENSSAVLFILDVETGDLLKRIDTGVTGCNGLSSPVLIDPDFDSRVDYIYAGDLQGNLWKFDLTSNDINDWGVAFGVDYGGDPDSINAREGDDPDALFTARGPGGNVQPITIQPDVMFHCDRGQESFMVLFGTGRYLGIDDLSDTNTQTVYGIWDFGDNVDDEEYVGRFDRGAPGFNEVSGPLLDTDVSLLEQDEAFSGTTTFGSQTLFLRVLSANVADWSVTTDDEGTCGDHHGTALSECDPNGIGTLPDPIRNIGWHFDLPLARERVTSDVLIRFGNLIYITFIPDDSPCATGGSSIVHEVNACSGARLLVPQFDLNNDGIIDENDLITIEDPNNPGTFIQVAPTGQRFEGRLQPPAIVTMPTDPNAIRPPKTEKKYFSSSTGKIDTIEEKGGSYGIIYWKELFFED